MKLNFEEEDRKTRMQCAHQQPGKEGPKLHDVQKTIPARHC